MRQQSRRIVCVGGRLTERDSAGPRVYDYLAQRELPVGVQLIDGGLAGLDLIRFIDGAAKVVFVDSAANFAPEEEIMVFNLQDVIDATSCTSLSHADGFVYLLHTIPEIYTDRLPEIYFVGVQGAPRNRLIRKAAETSLQLAADSS